MDDYGALSEAVAMGIAEAAGGVLAVAVVLAAPLVIKAGVRLVLNTIYADSDNKWWNDRHW